MGRTIAIGDIHGCLAKLADLVARLEPAADDTLIFLGDYIDRGPDSRGVVDFLIELGQRCRCIFLRGNHEDMLLSYLEYGTNRTLYFANGGLSTLASYGLSAKTSSRRDMAEALPLDHRDFFAGLKWVHEEQQYIFVHAGLQAGLSVDDQPREVLVWTRDEFIFSDTGRARKVVFGHTPFTRPFVKPDKIGIDTGAVYGGPLTAIILPQETFIHSFA